MQFETAGAATFVQTWRGICGGDKTSKPHYRTAFERLPSTLIPSLMMVERTEGDQYVVRFMGTLRADRWGDELTGKDSMEFMASPVASAARRNLPTLSEHPCGIHLIARNTTPAGREVEMEIVVVPVANDPGRASRFLLFMTEIAVIGFTDQAGQIRTIAASEWLDLGAGVPAELPVR